MELSEFEATEQVPGQSRLHREILFEKKNQKQKQKKESVVGMAFGTTCSMGNLSAEKGCSE